MWSYFRIQNRPIRNGHGRNTCCAFPEQQLNPEIQSPICGFNNNLDDYNHGLEDDVPGIQLRTARGSRRLRGGGSRARGARASGVGTTSGPWWAVAYDDDARDIRWSKAKLNFPSPAGAAPTAAGTQLPPRRSSYQL